MLSGEVVNGYIGRGIGNVLKNISQSISGGILWMGADKSYGISGGRIADELVSEGASLFVVFGGRFDDRSFPIHRTILCFEDIREEDSREPRFESRSDMLALSNQ